LGIGDWGLGIGDWGQSPIPNPHQNYKLKILNFINLLLFKNNLLNKLNKRSDY